MNGARDAFLAGARLPRDERGSGMGRDAPDQPEQLLHDGAAPDHSTQLEAMGGFVFRGEEGSATLNALTDGTEELLQPLEIERLPDVIQRAELHRFNCGIHGRVSGHQNHLALGMCLAQRAQHVEASDFWHAQIDDGSVDGLMCVLLESLPCAGVRPHVKLHRTGEP